MVSLLGSCPKVSARLCHIAARCLHSQGRKLVTVQPSLSQWRKALHTLNNRILIEQSTSKVAVGRTILTGISSNQGYLPSGYSIVVPLFRQGNTVVFVRCMSSSGGDQKVTAVDAFLYLLSILILFIGLGYAGVPLFKLFCRVCKILSIYCCWICS